MEQLHLGGKIHRFLYFFAVSDIILWYQEWIFLNRNRKYLKKKTTMVFCEVD